MKINKFYLLNFLLLFLLTFQFSCKKSDNITEREKTLNLTAPSGELLASSINELKNQASKIILQKTGRKENFEITNIEYFQVNKGISALINYKLEDGTSGNYAVNSGIPYKLKGDLRVKESKNNISKTIARNVQNEATVKVTITCTIVGNCNECLVRGTVDLNTGVMTYECSCTYCTATVTSTVD